MVPKEQLLEEEQEDKKTAGAAGAAGGEALTTLLINLLDMSGSMYGIIDEIRGGYNAFLDANKGLPGEAYCFTVTFDNTTQVLADGVDVEEMEHIGPDRSFARGGTALYDAVVETIGLVDKWIEENGKPDKILFQVQTDGYENMSQNYPARNPEAIKEMKAIVKEREDAGWTFSYIGCENAVEAAQELGVSRKMSQVTSADMAATSAGAKGYKGLIANKAMMFRTATADAYEITAEDKRALKGESATTTTLSIDTENVSADDEG